MNTLEIIKKRTLKQRALFAAQYTNAKAYRGVPYKNLAAGPAVHGNLTYRGVSYNK